MEGLCLSEVHADRREAAGDGRSGRSAQAAGPRGEPGERAERDLRLPGQHRRNARGRPHVFRGALQNHAGE